MAKLSKSQWKSAKNCMFSIYTSTIVVKVRFDDSLELLTHAIKCTQETAIRHAEFPSAQTDVPPFSIDHLKHALFLWS